MQKVQITVAIPDAAQYDEVLAAARAAGLTVEGSFPKLGIATGSIASDDLPVLRNVAGIGSVEEQRTYRAI